MKYEFWRNKKLEFINNPSILDTQKYLFLKLSDNQLHLNIRHTLAPLNLPRQCPHNRLSKAFRRYVCGTSAIAARSGSASGGKGRG